ncbi:MAG: gamma-glutamyl-gamma-aminobutyrate hydrolase family protein [Actinomycetota bacterium]
MSAPLIAIVGREVTEAQGLRGPGIASGRLYLEAIARAGGLPVIVPPLDIGASREAPILRDHVAGIVSRCDGVVLHGGGDIDPRLYGQDPATDTLYGLNDRHDRFEVAFVDAVLASRTPLLAICRGLQVLNVARGGTLVQDLGPDHPGHRKTLHPVRLVAGSRVALAMDAMHPQRCHSFHHQAVDVLGAGLVVTGSSEDGIIEAVETEDDSWTVGVQWHPEDTAAEDPEQQRLFDALVVASQR